MINATPIAFTERTGYEFHTEAELRRDEAEDGYEAMYGTEGAVEIYRMIQIELRRRGLRLMELS